MASSDSKKCEGRNKSETEIEQLARQKDMGLSVVGKLEAKFPTTFPTMYFLLDKKCLPSDTDKEVRTRFKSWCPYCERTFEEYTKFVRHHDKDPQFKRQYSKHLITELHEWDDDKLRFEKRITWKERGKVERIVTNGTRSAAQNESIRHNGSPDKESNNDLVLMDVTGAKSIFFENGTSQKETSRKMSQKPVAPSMKPSLHSTSFVSSFPTILQYQNTIGQSAAEPSQTTVTSDAAKKSTMNFTNSTKEQPPIEMPLDLRAKKVGSSDQGQGDGQWKNEEKNHMEVDATVDEAEEEEVSLCKHFHLLLQS